MAGNRNPTVKKIAPGPGRPKGSKNINSMASVKKLEELGFDPIEYMVKKYHEIQNKLDALEKEGKGSSGAYAQLTATQGTLINNLMAYGYKKIPERLEKENLDRKPIAIQLTSSKPAANNKEGNKNGDEP